ncbi:hypothetical protein D3C80_1534440 [compost metagenome]
MQYGRSACFKALACSSAVSPVMVRSATGAEPSDVSAVQRCSLTSGVISTPSLTRMSTSQSAAHARSDVSWIPASGWSDTVFASDASSESEPPRSCQSPRMASMAARTEPPKSKTKTWL